MPRAQILLSVAAVAAVALAASASASALAGPAWTQRPTPVLVGDPASWEHGVVGEPTVLAVGGELVMWYTAGYSDHNALGRATSTDGVHWTKTGPVLGQGASGFAGNVTHTNVVYRHGRFYAYFNADATSLGHVDPNLYRAVSADGVHWRVGALPVLTPGAWDNSLANSYEWADKAGWHMVYEAMDDAAGRGGRYLIGAARSRDGIRWTKTAGPLLALRRGAGMTGGPWVVAGKAGYTVYYHASTGDDNLPTDIYSAHSTDMRAWTPSAAPAVARAFAGWQGYQTADPSVVVFHGRAMMFFAAWGADGGGIGLATP